MTTHQASVAPQPTTPLRAADGSLWQVDRVRSVLMVGFPPQAQIDCVLVQLPDDHPYPEGRRPPPPPIDWATQRSGPEEPPDRSDIRFDVGVLRRKVVDDQGRERCPRCDALARATNPDCVDLWHRHGWKRRWGRGGKDVRI
jgi:hypothetical protein